MSCDSHVGVVWQSCWCHVTVMWVLCGSHVGVMWQSCVKEPFTCMSASYVIVCFINFALTFQVL